MTDVQRKAPNPSPKADAEALKWLLEQHAAPCGDAKCDSVYCYVARRLVEGQQMAVFVADAIDAHVEGRWWQDAELQERLLARGFLAEVHATEPCGDGCACADVTDFPTDCYRVTPLGEVARAFWPTPSGVSTTHPTRAAKGGSE